MKQLIVTFKSRNDTMSFYNLLKSKNIFCSIINTPKIIGSPCSLSIKTNLDSLPKIRAFVNFNNLNIGLFVYEPQLNFASKIS